MDEFRGFYSGRNLENYCKLIGLNSLENYEKILDIGSGFSTTISKLSDMGKYAIAVDIGYQNIDEMIKKYLNQEIPVSLVEARKGKLKNITKDCKTYKEAIKKVRAFRKKHVQDFLEAYKQNLKNYITESFFDLPFKDNSFDLVISVESLGNKNYFSYEQFMEGIKEITRISREARIHSKYLHKQTSQLEKFMSTNNFEFSQTKKLLVIKN